MIFAEDSSSDEDNFDPQELAAYQELTQEAPETKRSCINDKVGLLSKLDEISLPEKMPWIEKLDFVTNQPLEIENGQDDLKREAEFYAQSLAVATKAILQMEQARVPYMRPADFFAEMIKPDSQMQRIKDSLLKDKKKMDNSALRQKEKQQRKYAGQVKSAKLQDRQKKKMETMDTLKRNKKLGRTGGITKEHSMVGSIDSALEQGRKETADKREKNKSKKRTRADKKYGFGQNNKRQKRNTSESVDQSDGRGAGAYNPHRNKEHGITGKGRGGGRGGRGGGRGGRGGKAPAKRPGKDRRASMK